MRGAQIKKEDLELYRFYLSEDNKHPAKKLSIKTQRILEYRYDDKMTYADISKKVKMSEVKVRSEIRLFRRRAQIAKWYTERID